MKDSEIKGSWHIAVILTPKQPFIDWQTNMLQEGIETLAGTEPSVYMFPDYNSIVEVEQALAKIFDKMFYNELRDCTDNELLFPKSRTYRKFNEWFQAVVTLNVFRVVEKGVAFSKDELTEHQKRLGMAHAFHEKLLGHLEEYKDYLLNEKSDGTLATYGDLTHQFINFLFGILVTDFSEITVAMVRSMFYSEFKKYNQEQISKEELRGILKGFFQFLEKKHGVKCERVSKALDSPIRK
jgi:hypothetical protein